MRGVWLVPIVMTACAASPTPPVASSRAHLAPGTPAGGPPNDRDDDGILDPDDRCPKEAETYNGIQDDDGCPDARPQAARPPGSPPEIDERVLFERSRVEIVPTSRAALDRVAFRLKAQPSLFPVVALEGHAAPNEERTMPLSLARASAVREALIERGIDPSRLIARASGATTPVCRRAHERCAAQNRRVEMAVLPPPKPPEPEPAETEPATEEEGEQAPAPPVERAAAPPVERLVFAKGSASLGPKALPVLDLLAGFLKANPSTLEIEGHAGPDEKRPAELARARADAVRNYMRACGVNGASLIVRAYGAGTPACKQKGAACKALNRRVELRLP